mgnify:CR=1 FL=1
MDHFGKPLPRRSPGRRRSDRVNRFVKNVVAPLLTAIIAGLLYSRGLP